MLGNALVEADRAEFVDALGPRVFAMEIARRERRDRVCEVIAARLLTAASVTMLISSSGDVVYLT